MKEFNMKEFLKKFPPNYCAHCGKFFENAKQLANHSNQIEVEYHGAIDRELDDDLEKLG